MQIQFSGRRIFQPGEKTDWGGSNNKMMVNGGREHARVLLNDEGVQHMSAYRGLSTFFHDAVDESDFYWNTDEMRDLEVRIKRDFADPGIPMDTQEQVDAFVNAWKARLQAELPKAFPGKKIGE